MSRKRTFHVTLERTYKVTLDEAKFTPEFNAEYAQGFSKDTRLIAHAERVALYVDAHGGILFSDAFIEGMGNAKEMNIEAEEIDDDLASYEVKAASEGQS